MFPLSRTCGALGSAKTFCDTKKKDCGEPGCPNDHCSQVLAAGADVIETHTLNSDLSPLRSHEAMGMLGAQEVMMQVGYPLSAGNRHIQIFYAILDVR